MKLILNIDEATLKNMQGYCDTQNIDINKLIENLFNRHIQEPADVIDKLHAKNGNIKELEDFRILLTQYLNEATYDIEESAKSDEAYPTDENMVNVFRGLNRDLIDNPYLLTRLFKVYKGE